MSQNGNRIRKFVWTLKRGEAATYGYIAEKFNPELKTPTSPRGVGRAVWKGATSEHGFSWWRVVDNKFQPKDKEAKEKLIGEKWKFQGDVIHPSRQNKIKQIAQ